MEAEGDDLDNLFEENDNEERQNDPENGESTTEQSAGVRVAPPKRIIKNPRLKFNPERLCGERGIPVLVDHFKNVKFKGKGHEKDDLDKLLATLEHWTHRLFPSMKFEDCLHQIEKLGKKRPVQTCVRKIRLDMPILNSDFVKDDEEDNVLRNDDPDVEPSTEDAFDRLLGQSRDILRAENAEANFAPTHVVTNDSGGHILGSSFDSSLTEEQKERMARNRLLAAERRKAKLAAMQMNISDSQSDIQASNSQDLSIAFESLLKPSNSEVNNAASMLNEMDTSYVEVGDNTNKESSSPDLRNKNSEILGLDDLIDLVDEEESLPDNIIAEKNISSVSDISVVEMNEISKDTEQVNISNSTTLNMDTSNGTVENTIINKNVYKENGLSFDDTVPVYISHSTAELNMTDVIEKDIINKNFEENGISYENTLPISIPSINMDTSKDSLGKETFESNEVKKVASDELLGLESMMDLVDEE